jgi:hypothetical protein
MSKKQETIFFKNQNQKYPCLLGDKFVNGNTFALLLKLICPFSLGGMNIIIFLRCGYNRK